jgi:hypothetical protein
MGERDGWRLIWAVYGVQAVVTTRRKQSKEAKKLAAATRRHMKKSRAIAMLGFALEAVAWAGRSCDWIHAPVTSS